MRSHPGKTRTFPAIGRHFESSRLGGRLMASAYDLLVPILSRSTPSQASPRPAANQQGSPHRRRSALGA